MKLKRLDRGRIYWLEVNQQEAISLIISLCQQIEDKSPNGGRREYCADGAPYFSIVVHCDKKESRP